jgi:Major capsid protein Gp23
MDISNFKFFKGFVLFSLQSEIDQINRINLTIVTREVTTNTRRLGVLWTPEMAQDIQAYYNIDAVAELSRLITEEIDNQIITDLINYASIINSFKFFN